MYPRMNNITAITMNAHRLITMHFLGELALDEFVTNNGALLDAARLAGVEILNVAVPTTLSFALKSSLAEYTPLSLVVA